MIQYNIELENFEPAPGSKLLEYFNRRLNELSNQPDVEIIKAKLAISYHKPEGRNIDYLNSENIPMPGRMPPFYHWCQVLCNIRKVQCNIVYYSQVYFTDSIDMSINEGLSRVTRYPSR